MAVLADITVSPRVEPTLVARERVVLGPIPDWVVPSSYDSGFKAKPGTPLTHLLISKQMHAEHHQTFVQTAVRLESLEAVQHQSQWCLEFEPRTQKVTIHSIRVRRGEQAMEQADLGRIRLLQREEGLERFIIDGWFTMLLLLDDVRPGDVIETSYTVENQPRLLSEYCSAIFTLPQGIAVGNYHFSIRHDAARPMQWKASAPEMKPVETRENGSVLWTWSGRNADDRQPEINSPEWHMDYPWVQVSDIPDWATVGRAYAAAWQEETGDGSVAELATQFGESQPDLPGRIEKAIQTIQDDYRYLSVNLDLGGQIPTAPGVVARQRYGDCKDLSFLLVCVLKRLGATARPILVNTMLRHSVNQMLPMPLFNHAVVEYQVQGETRWVDPTLKRQGGGALTRFIPGYGAGLPVDADSAGLIEPPRTPSNANLYELNESILLDTTGAPSLLSVILRARGSHAEALRHQFNTASLEDVAKERLQIITSRFVNARRVGQLEFRDDREVNEFVVAEVFEINGFLTLAQSPGFCRLPFANNLVVHLLPLPEAKSRRTPFALSHPCNIIHVIEVEAPTLRPMGYPPADLSDAFVKFSRREKSLHRSWSMTLKLTTLADAVPADRIEEHRNVVEQIWRESLVQLVVPVGYAHLFKRHDFGALPPPSRQPSPESELALRTAMSPSALALDGTTTGSSRHRRRRSRTRINSVTPSGSSDAAGAAPTGSVTAPSAKPGNRQHGKHRPKKNKILWPVFIILTVLALIAAVIVAFKT